MDDQEHYFSRAKFGDDYSRVSHGGLESITSIELDLDCLAISNTNDLQQRSQSSTSYLEDQEDATFNYVVSLLIAADNFMTENFMTSFREQPISAQSSKTGEETRDQNMIINSVPQTSLSRFSGGEDVCTQANSNGTVCVITAESSFS